MNANCSNGCKQCGRDFGGLGAFDKHQDVDYKRQPVIVCRDPATLGMHQDRHGRWRMETPGTPWWKTDDDEPTMVPAEPSAVQQAQA